MDIWEIVKQFALNVLTSLLGRVTKKSAVVVRKWIALGKYLKHIVEDNEVVLLQGILSHGHLIRPVEVKRSEIVIPLSLSLDWSSDMFEEPHSFLEHDIEQEINRERRRQTIRFDKLLQEFSATNQVVIIQGAAGSGKTTSLRWLTLDLAAPALRKHHFSQAFSPKKIPLFLRLNQYAQQLHAQGQLSLEQYVQDMLAQIDAHLPANLSRLWQRGQCIFLFDGLDEVGDDNLRRDVIDNIARFITLTNHKSNAHRFNRFIITSRTTGYSSLELERIAVPCSCYTLHGLKDKQIQDFLKKWFLAVERSQVTETHAGQRVVVWQDREARRAKQAADKHCKTLWRTIKHDPDIRKLAGTPLTLAHLALLKHSRRNLPQHSLDLYQSVTHTMLLRSRASDHNLFTRGEIHHAEQVLGELAYANYPQSTPLTRKEVEDKTRKVIEKFERHHSQQMSDDFIARLSSSGLFVEVERGSYNFTHRMFQEYFVALHLLEHHTAEELKEFVLEYYASNAWRELLLHVIAVKSHKTKHQASELIQAIADHNNPYDRLLQRNLLFAASSIGRCHPDSIARDLQCAIANRLFDLYGDELGNGRYRQVQQEIERVALDWLREVSRSSDGHPALLEVWRQALCNVDGDLPLRQQGAVSLLATLVPDLAHGHPAVLQALLPTIIRLAGLPDEHCPPEMRTYMPFRLKELVPPKVAAYAFVALRLLYAAGPAGWLHKEWQGWNEGRPELLQRLSQHAHELNYLFTPAALPDKRESPNWRKQIQIAWGWKQEHQGKSRDIQRQLLKNSDTVRYPYAYLIKQMLECELATPHISWPQLWDAFLRETMETGNAATYQPSLDLRLLLCKDDRQKRQRIAEELVAALSGQQQNQALLTITHIYQRELKSSRNEQSAFYLRDLRDKHYLSDLQGLRYQRDVLDVQHRLHVLDILDIRYLTELPSIRYLEYLANMLKILNLSAMRDFRDENYPRYLLYLRHLQDALNLLQSIDIPDVPEIIDLRDMLEREQIVSILCDLLAQECEEIFSTVLYTLYSVIATYEVLPSPLRQKVDASMQQFEQHCQPLPTESSLLLRAILSRIDQPAASEAGFLTQEEVDERTTKLQRFNQAEELTRAAVEEIFMACTDVHELSEEKQSEVRAATVQQAAWNILDQKRSLKEDALPIVIEALGSTDARICAAAALLLKNCKPLPLAVREAAVEKIMRILENDQLAFRPLGLLSPMQILRLVDVLFETVQALAQ